MGDGDVAVYAQISALVKLLRAYFATRQSDEVLIAEGESSARRL